MVKKLYIDTKKASQVISNVTWREGKCYRAFTEKLPGRTCFIPVDLLELVGVKLTAEQIRALNLQEDLEVKE